MGENFSNRKTVWSPNLALFWAKGPYTLKWLSQQFYYKKTYVQLLANSMQVYRNVIVCMDDNSVLYNYFQIITSLLPISWCICLLPLTKLAILSTASFSVLFGSFSLSSNLHSVFIKAHLLWGAHQWAHMLLSPGVHSWSLYDSACRCPWQVVLNIHIQCICMYKCRCTHIVFDWW